VSIRRSVVASAVPALLVVAALVAVPAVVSAQRVPVARIGSRVRVIVSTIGHERITGRIDSFPGDSVRLDTSGVRRRLGLDTGPVLVDEYRYVTIPRSEITNLEISGGRTAGRSTLVGLLGGAVGGGLFFGLAGRSNVDPTAGSFSHEFGKGAIVGGIIGGVIGYAWGGERWLPARWAVNGAGR
jgi:hypothetical protein